MAEKSQLIRNQQLSQQMVYHMNCLKEKIKKRVSEQEHHLSGNGIT